MISELTLHQNFQFEKKFFINFPFASRTTFCKSLIFRIKTSDFKKIHKKNLLNNNKNNNVKVKSTLTTR